MEGLEAALERADAEDAVGPHRTGEALGLDLAQIGALEQTAEEPARRGRDHDAVGLGQGLEPGGQVRGLADDRLLLRGAAAEQVAHHHEPGRDADPGPQRSPGRRGQPAHRRHELEAGPHRPLGIILVRLGKPK